jgi:Rieske Fe-S protein
MFLSSPPDTGTIAVDCPERPGEGVVLHCQDAGLLLMNDADGLYCMSDSCTHLGCRLKPSGDRLICPCHRGVFDLQGNPLSGPPQRSLPHFHVSSGKDGTVLVTTTRTVDRAYRLAL